MNPSTQKQLESQEANEAEALAGAVIEATEASAEDADLEALRAARINVMDAIGQTLEGLLKEAVMFRTDHEREWAADIRQFETGRAYESSMIQPTKQYSSSESWQVASDNITRYATVTYAARLGDMLFPTSDRNWDIDHTPDPELPPEVMANLEESLRQIIGEGKVSEERALAMKDDLINAVASKRVDRMRTKIDDQLAECGYNDEGRKAIMDACKIGHGVIKGPFAKARRRRRYMADQGYRAVVEEVLTEPVVKWVDPWMVYPRPCRRIEDCPGVFELHEMSARRVDELRIQPGFSSQQVNRLLKMKPSWSPVIGTLTTLQYIDDVTLSARQENYCVFEYNGEMPQEAVIAFIGQLMDEASISEDQAQELRSFVQDSNAVHLDCNVWFSQGVVLKIAVSPVDVDSCMYKFFAFEKHEASPFGKGVPRILRDPQFSIQQLWSAMHLNALMSSAPQIAILKGALEAEGGGTDGKKDLSFTKPRVWSFTGDVSDIRQAMQVFTVTNTIGGSMPVYERAKQNAQEQTMLPLISQGEPTQAVQTSSGMAMLMNASNVVQRRLAAEFDASITTPLIEAMYDWNMQHGPDDLKGDYRIVARASSHLLVKDIQAQHFFYALSQYAANPNLAPRMKWDAWAEEGLRIMDISPSKYLMSQEEIDAQQAAMAEQQPPPDPAAIRAEAAMQDAKTRAQTAQVNAQIAQERLALQREDRALDYEDRIADRETRERIAQVGLQGKLVAVDAATQQRIMELQAESEKEADRNATQTRIAGMKAAQSAQDKAMDMRRDIFEAEVEKNTAPGPRLA